MTAPKGVASGVPWSEPTPPAPASPPTEVTAVIGEVRPGDPAMWHPQSYVEWEGQERTRTVLAAWKEQVADERGLRRSYAKAVLMLIAGQVLGVFALVVAQGLGRLHLDTPVLQVLLPSVLGEVFGLGSLVTKYLFNQSLRHSMDSLALGARPPA